MERFEVLTVEEMLIVVFGIVRLCGLTGLPTSRRNVTSPSSHWIEVVQDRIQCQVSEMMMVVVIIITFDFLNGYRQSRTDR
jgi:hypothetical protein